ncbi:MAG TPA: hypothetical protein VM409_04105 [Chloroflexia bacterium]|nr:hypothetical protein [Chloroflexia bacterium]
MHFALVPGLLVTMLAALLGSAQPPHGDRHALDGSAALFSVAAQATTTATLTVGTSQTPAATGTVSTSGTVTETTLSATATLTTSAQTTPIPLPTPAARGSLQGNPLDPNFLFGVPNPPMGPFAWAFLAFMLAFLAAAGYFLLVKRPEWKRSNSVLFRAANRWAPVGLWVGIPGILLLLFRILPLDFFNLRFWLYLWTLAALVAVAWFFYWYRTRYPKEVAKYQKSQRARQYIPGAASKGANRQAAQSRPKAATVTNTTTTEAGRPATSGSPGQGRQQKGGKRSKRR